MIEKPALGVRGTLVRCRDGRFVFRVFGDRDPATNQRPFKDYELHVEDLMIEVASDYYRLFEPEPGEDGKRRVDYQTPAYRANPEKFWAEFNVASESIQADPAALTELQREDKAWEATLADGLEDKDKDRAL